MTHRIFEYQLRCAEFEDDFGGNRAEVRSNITAFFNTAGAEGWELVHVSTLNLGGKIFLDGTFKREIL